LRGLTSIGLYPPQVYSSEIERKKNAAAKKAATATGVVLSIAGMKKTVNFLVGYFDKYISGASAPAAGSRAERSCRRPEFFCREGTDLGCVAYSVLIHHPSNHTGLKASDPVSG